MNQARLGILQGRETVHVLPEMQVGEWRVINQPTSNPPVAWAAAAQVL
jgi:hypothetical protein